MIDAHAHLTDARLVDEVEAVVARAEAAGVRRILTCGDDIASSRAALQLAQAHPALRVAVGVHPHRAASLDAAALAALRELAADSRVVAIGEIGIDHSGRSAAPDVQEQAFLAQLDLADELGLPVVVHVREAGPKVRALLAARRLRAQLHCYSEGPDEIAAWVELGFVISFAGTVTFKANGALRAAAAAVPAGRILIETDAPYLAPQPHRGRRSEPAFIGATYAAVAAARGITVSALEAEVDRSAALLFGPRW
ncbi:MAG TPA: TatD family hydrolase [Candidatus Saccharimonadales bacterium]|nr:TatD family hydrolase [Candidatus Saccharimonadales bacterium]